MRSDQFLYIEDVRSGDRPAPVREFRHQQQYAPSVSGTQGGRNVFATLLNRVHPPPHRRRPHTGQVTGRHQQLRLVGFQPLALHSTIEHYTGDGKRLYLTKFVLSCHPNPALYLDAAGKYLQRDPSIRHYLYQDIDGLALDALDNTNVETIT